MALSIGALLCHIGKWLVLQGGFLGAASSFDRCRVDIEFCLVFSHTMLIGRQANTPLIHS